MAGLISEAAAVGIRAALDITLVHTCTIQPYTAGAEDAHGNATQTAGTPVTAVPCRYEPEERVRVVNDEGGTSFVFAPTLTVKHDAALDATDHVLTILASDGATVLAAGPFEVGQAIHEAGLGPVLQKRYVLRGAKATT